MKRTRNCFRSNFSERSAIVLFLLISSFQGSALTHPINQKNRQQTILERPIAHSRWVQVQDSPGFCRPRSTALSVASSPDTGEFFVRNRVMEQRRKATACLKQGNLRGAHEAIQDMMSILPDSTTTTTTSNGNINDDFRIDAVEEHATVDRTLQMFFQQAFAAPHRGRSARRRILMGFDAIQMQLSTAKLQSPYNEVPKSILRDAIRALVGLSGTKSKQTNIPDATLQTADGAFRLLQRLVTGVGIRNYNSTTIQVYESDFNGVLNAYSNVGRMDMAHKVVGLQVRTNSAPPLSACAYSILLKGYGRLRDSNNIKMILSYAQDRGVEPDVVMLNSLIDAYINCGELQKAQQVFAFMQDPTKADQGSADSEHRKLLKSPAIPPPNRRTYNTILKGLANAGFLEEAIQLSQEMRQSKLWDDITTNTLVQAAINGGDFAFAEIVLADYTVKTSKPDQSHPNVQAYTNLLDAYGKNGNLEKAVGVLQLMRSRQVEANEVTYSCMVGAFARANKLEQAEKLVRYMSSHGVIPTAITYNSLISGLLYQMSDVQGRYFCNELVDQSLRYLKKMLDEKVRPNAITISTIVDSFGRCDPPRVLEAKSLVEKLVNRTIISSNNNKVGTSLINVCGLGKDLQGAFDTFRELKKPDTVAINAFLMACIRCGKEKMALESFNHYYVGDRCAMQPDVVSYSIMISMHLRKRSIEGIYQASKFYDAMKQRSISPDIALVDMILRELINKGKQSGLQKSDARFIAKVLRDAENLDWPDGHLNRRRRAVDALFRVTASDDMWRQEANLVGISSSAPKTEDDIFKRHGWNTVDSGFKLWGNVSPSTPAPLSSGPGSPSQDDFLISKGWNDVDSGFRII